MFKGVHSVMYFVSDVEQACRWYSAAFETEPVYLLPNFPVLRVGDVELCFHSADSKISSGAAGSVIYWRVDHLPNARERLERMGGKLYRGPLEIEDGCAICQILDPFGNLIGLMGPKS